MFVFSLILLLATAQSPPDRQPRLDFGACVGKARLNLDAQQIQALRSEAGPEGWPEACRQARDANARRLSLTRLILASGRSPAPGYAAAARYAALALDASDPDTASLYAHVARDQVARQSLSPTAKAFYAPGLSPVALKLLDGLITADALYADLASRAWLRPTVARRGWFTISRSGEDADMAAWLIVQHGDGDRAFQKAMIDILIPLAKTGDTSPNRLAFLYDRWAAGANEPQLYGLQGRCVAANRWEPVPIADPENVDARRREAGLPGTMAERLVEESRRCR